jgi:hypothetical protein
MYERNFKVMHRIKEKKESTDNRIKALHTSFHIEADKMMTNTSVSVTNVLSIIDFREDAVILKMRKGKIKISGESLSISIYENKIVEIFGKVRNIEFL